AARAEGRGGEDGERLDGELPRVAEQEAVGWRAPCLLREDSREERADHPAEAVRGGDVEGIVEARPRARYDREGARHRRERPDQERGLRSHETGRGRDRD